MAIREPAVSGYFYPGEVKALLDAVDACLAKGAQGPPQPAIAAIMPHAGYVYSGGTAGAVAAAIDVPRRVIGLGPKHTRLGARAAVAAASAWRFPFGDVPMDADTVDAIAATGLVARDDAAHRSEHSLEVEVPFLWRRNPALRFTPIALGPLGVEELRELGAALASVVRAAGEPVLIVASTDMSHHLSAGTARRLDELAIARILALDPTGLYRTVLEHDISMCGVAPVTAALVAAAALGAQGAALVRYTSSAEATGDTSSVVGYAGAIISA
jgi:MEMO1 family protein